MGNNATNFNKKRTKTAHVKSWNITIPWNMSLEIHVLVWDRHNNVAGFVCDTCKECFSYFFFRIVCRCSLQILQNERIFPLHPWSLKCSCHLSKILLLKWTQYLFLTCTYFYLPIQSYKSTRNVSKHKWSGQ